jgi:hypothetical protein
VPPRIRFVAFGILVACCALLIAGCGGGDKGGGDKGGGDKTTGTSTAHAAKATGTFKLTFEPPTADNKDASDLIHATAVVKEVVDAMNSSVALPRDIAVRIQNANDGPSYDPSTRTLVIGYPFVMLVAQTFSDADPNIKDADLASKTNSVIAFVLLHEIGHALVDQLHLPVTGREEDSVDNLATVLTAGVIKEGGIALDSAEFFADLQQDPKTLKASDFWDEHSLDAQRANTMACLVYGSDPKKFAGLEQFIPEERRVRCEGEWKQAFDSWDQLLSPHLKG